MKKYILFTLIIVAGTAFGFVSSQSSQETKNDAIQKIIPKRGIDKSGFIQINQDSW